MNIKKKYSTYDCFYSPNDNNSSITLLYNIICYVNNVINKLSNKSNNNVIDELSNNNVIDDKIISYYYNKYTNEYNNKYNINNRYKYEQNIILNTYKYLLAFQNNN